MLLQRRKSISVNVCLIEKKFEQIRKVIRKLKFQNFLKLYFLVFFDV